ncbi:MAG: hypothetical protein JOY81_07545 [Alphaproteobacteria bacterium]|nr:hypothetical protein [Alphaproteobacteria bacterium]
MLIRRCSTLLALLAIPSAASAQSGDAAYCEQLASLANRYIQTPYDRGGAPDIDIAEAINQCRSGEPAKGIPVLERKLRSNGFTLPKR